MQRLVRLRTEIGHPEKPGEPLPQDQAAQRAGVTARQWQRWESGVSVPYARNLSAVADAFKFDVAEFYDGPAGQKPIVTPELFPATVDDRLDRMERRLMNLLEQQNELLARQSVILEKIEAAMDAESVTSRVDEAIAQVVRERGGTALEAAPPPPARARSRTAK